MKRLYYAIGNIVTADKKPALSIVAIDATNGLIKSVEPYSERISGNIPPGQILYRAKPDELILPGMIDLHIHAREDETGRHNYKENYQTAADAALNGGVVKMAAMPNTPSPLISQRQLEWHRRKIASLRHPVSIVNYVGIGPGTRPLEGKHIYKAYTGPSVGPLFFKNMSELENTLQHYGGENISFHVEDFGELAKHRQEATHSKRRPEECITVLLEPLLQLIEKYRIRAKLCHWSMGGHTFESIAAHRHRMARLDLGYNTTLEVSPMHLLFDEEMTRQDPFLWPYLQMNPALRKRTHRMDLIEGLRTGFVDFLATDHAPHTLEEKFKHFSPHKTTMGESAEAVYLRLKTENPALCRELCHMDGTSGATWLDTYATVAGYLVNQHQFTWLDIARCTSYNPGLFVNPYMDKKKFGCGFGQISPGFRSAFTIMRPNVETTVRRQDLKTKAHWSPLENKKMIGRLIGVIVGSQFFDCDP